MSAPTMTAAEAADLLVKNIDAQPAATYKDVVRGFMAGHWPSVPEAAPRVVTGVQLADALRKEGIFIHSDTHNTDRLNRAAARLTARAGATPNSGAGSSSSGVTETAAGIQTVPVTIVRRPVERPSPFLAAPSAGLYMKRSQDGEISGPVRLPEGCIVGRSVAAICRVDTDAPTWIERTPVQTARAWTAGDCEALVGQRCVVEYDHGGDGLVHHEADWHTAEWIANSFNRAEVAAAAVVPNILPATLPEVSP
jgi:hypothetical protein